MARRLAAVLAADIVGYSRLVESDEAGTLAAVKKLLKTLIEPKARQYQGRIVKEMGDGLLLEFSSAVDAAICAVEIQLAATERNAKLRPDSQISYRIGINVGDIVVDGDDIFGDGVIIASRLEGLAEPGGICISENALNQIAGKLDLDFKALGNRKVKNISAPVLVYKIMLDGKAEALKSDIVDAGARHGPLYRNYRAGLAAIALLAALAFMWWQFPVTEHANDRKGSGNAERSGLAPRETKPSIAVLPFTDLSETKDQSYFSDGLAEDLITDLSRISGLGVLARASTFAYRDTSRDVRKIGQELGANYILDGSVRRFEHHLRVIAQLVDTETGHNIWAERFDRPDSDLFNLLEELRVKIVSALKVKLSSREEKWLKKRPTSDPQAYDHYLRGLQQVSFFTREANDRARAEFEKAIAIDPGFASAYAQLAQTYSLANENGWVPENADFEKKALSLAKRSVELDDELPQAYWSLGRIYTRPPYRDSGRALEALEKAVALDPNFADGFAFLASVRNVTGNAEEALASIEKAMRMNPGFPFWYYFEEGRAQFFLTRFEAAAESFSKAVERNPTVPWPHRFLVATYGHLGQIEDAEWEISELQGIGTAATISQSKAITTITDPGYLNLYLEGLRKGGMPE